MTREEKLLYILSRILEHYKEYPLPSKPSIYGDTEGISSYGSTLRRWGEELQEIIKKGLSL